MEKENKGVFNAMNKPQAFGLGIVSGILVLCTVGFFVLLSVMIPNKQSSSVKTSEEELKDAPKQFSECLDSGKYTAAVKEDFNLGLELGVGGTPNVFVNGYQVGGVIPFESMKQLVDTLLAGKEPDFNFLKDDEGKINKVTMPSLPNVVWEGKVDAPISMVEFADFECPFCVDFSSVIHQVLAAYPNEVKFTYRHFPLSKHLKAQGAAEAFECAKEQGHGMHMYDKLFELSGKGKLTTNNYKQAAAELGLQ